MSLSAPARHTVYICFRQVHGLRHLVRNVVRICRCLAGTVDLALIFEGKGEPVCFVDADFSGDVGTRRSTTRYASMLFGTCLVAEL
jgi:hypothetical protein